MEAPEKLYVDTDDRLSDSILYGFTEKRKDDDIEYVRKDAFIEKVVNFFEMLGYGFTITDNITHTNYDKKHLVEDFKNYLKGK